LAIWTIQDALCVMLKPLPCSPSGTGRTLGGS
jgi:hypothetical protein